MIGLALGLQQRLPAHQALRCLLAHLGLVAVGQARTHGTGRYKHAGQMAKMQGADEQARHDLVAHTQEQGRIEHVMRQGNGGSHGNHIAREETQLHARCALSDTVTHGRHTAGHLQGGTQLMRLVPQQLWIARVGLVGRQHVVVGTHHRQVRRSPGHDAQFVLRRHGGDGMGHVGTPQAVRAAGAVGQALDLRQVVASKALAAGANAVGHRLKRGMQGGRRHGVMV